MTAASPAVAQDKVVRLTSLDWPPFSGDALKDKGAAVAVVRAAFAAVGHEVSVSFYPWNRAVTLAREDSGIRGYFPEYAGAEVERDFILSVPLGTSPLGFAERVDAPVTWTGLDDLANARIGVVDGYVNTEDLDARIADGRLTADRANSDATNLKKLAAGRIDLAVIDRAVMTDLLRTNPDLKALAAGLRFNARPLEDKTLHIAFRKGAEGEALARLFAEGLSKIDAAAILSTALGS
ncbi:substrate-binding periplasmic protein [Azospirillum halopraeferens]|uniref:substrate-binding periplasmic protein n=1 Tax=Azospirillum halopraeferens TaxID=34010 RepID=UPI0003F7741D|nr:transporter substrate-binding domain-containing protein [Azospirillum halopraeferens]